MGGSMSSVIITGDTSGAITLAAPAVSGTTTLTLPATTGTVALTGAAVTYSQLPTGSVLQVVSATTTTPFVTTSGTYATTGFSASITPKFSTSKVLVLVNAFVTASVNACQPTITVYRNSTNIGFSTYGFGDFYSAAGGYSEIILPISFLDSPATTSSTTYTIYGRNSTSAGSATFFDGNRTSTLTLIEVAG